MPTLTAPTVPGNTPRLEIYQRVREPAPPPPNLDPAVLAIYEELRHADLVGCLDCLNIGLDFGLPRIRPALNALDADDMLCRLKAAGVRFDVDQAVQRLHNAFREQDNERRAIRDQAQASDFAV